MGIMSTMGTVVNKGAQLANTPAGKRAIMASAFLPLLTDFLGDSTPDPAKMEQISKVRDEMAARIAGEQNISLAKATQQVNQELEPLMQQAQQPQGVGTGKILADGADVGLTAGITYGPNLFGGGDKQTGSAAPDGSNDLTNLSPAELTAPEAGTSWDPAMDLEQIAPETELQLAPDHPMQPLAPETEMQTAPEATPIEAPEIPNPSHASDMIPELPDADPHAYDDIREMMMKQAAKKAGMAAAPEAAEGLAALLPEIGEIAGSAALAL